MRFICILILFFASQVHADEFFEVEHGGQPNHLIPLDYPPDEYDQRIAEHLFLTDGSLGRFISRPSFGAESCVSVHAEIPEESKQKHGGWRAVPENEKRYFITVTRASKSLWYSMADNNDEKKTKKVKVTRTDREISLPLAIAIQRAWGRMLQLTKYPANPSMGVDGITYQFSVWVRGLGSLQGETWTPEGGLPAEIASLGEALAKFTENKEEKEEPLIKRLKTLEAKIPKA